MIWRRHPRVRWMVTTWYCSWVVPGQSIKVAACSFRWRWLARIYVALKREPPKLKVINGGGAYVPRGVA